MKESLIERLRTPPVIRSLQEAEPDDFAVSRPELATILAARTEAANVLEAEWPFDREDVLHLERLIEHVIPTNEGLRSEVLINHTRSLADRIEARLKAG